jgi:regulator of replication initiation timing
MGKSKRTVPLAENEHVKELLAILDAHKPPGAEDLRAMLGNVARMEEQFAAAVAELAAMRRELNAIREENHPMRKVLQNAVTAMQTHVSKLREQLDALKEGVIEGCKNAVAAFKERGAAALDGIARFFNVRSALTALEKSFDSAARESDKAIAKIEAASAEYHEAGRHVRNIGRALAGKDPLPGAKPTGMAAKTAEAPFKAVRACTAVARNQARAALDALSRLEKTAEKPPPIKEQYGKAAKEAAMANAARERERTKPAPAREDR